MLARAAPGAPDNHVQFELARVDEIITRLQARLRAAGITDPSMPTGRSLSNPFLNDRAMQYWDADSLERWIGRRGREFGLDSSRP